MVRIALELGDRSEWVKLFDPRDYTLFVAGDSPPEVGDSVRIDLQVGRGGPRILFRGEVIARRIHLEGTLPRGCTVALGYEEREKINYLNGYVRGGLLNLREKRRLPVRLRTLYEGGGDRHESFTRDINEEGVFVVSEAPLAEETEVRLSFSIPDRSEALSLSGVVSHTVVIEDEDVPGMGIRFHLDGQTSEKLREIIDELEERFQRGDLPEECLL